MMKRKEIIDTYKQAIETYGVRAQKLMAIEEMSELTKEICKDFRGKIDREHLIEEMADVLIMLDQMLILYKISGEEVGLMRIKKVERLKERLEKQNDEIK
nr:MAG TPA: nucleoside triphosphate pyrophosphohydrolase [Bacteriophage sp.]DAR73961.1 MAG TPA: nucleoside triphosphate pyrophosphohydrolase [Caudoviricetes sp.]